MYGSADGSTWYYLIDLMYYTPQHIESLKYDTHDSDDAAADEEFFAKIPFASMSKSIFGEYAEYK